MRIRLTAVIYICLLILSSLNSNKNNLLVVEQVGDTFSIAASSFDTNGTISIAKSGYTPFAVSSWNVSGTGSGSCYVYGVWISGNNIRFKYRNNGSGTATLTIDFFIIYVKD